MIKELKILRQHGLQYVPDLKKAELTTLFRGRPEISEHIGEEEKKKVFDLCPVNAIELDEFSIDLGKCVFCKECQFACPDSIHFTNDYKLATNRREFLKIRPGANDKIKFDEALIRPEIRKLFKHSLKLRQVSAGGDNSCEMELNAAGNVNFDMGRFGIEFVASPRHADGLVISGPVSVNMAEALELTYAAIPNPKIVIAVGVDAISGGVFCPNGSIDRSFFDRFPIDLWVPGNPAHPLTFINGVLQLIGK